MTKPPATPVPGACSLPESKPELLQVACRVAKEPREWEENFPLFPSTLNFVLKPQFRIIGFPFLVGFECTLVVVDQFLATWLGFSNPVS